MARPIALTDMDGVLADFDAGVIETLRQERPDIAINPNRENFYIADDYPEHAEAISEIQSRPGFFLNLPLISHAQIGWRRLEYLGYEPRICSSPLSINPTCAEEKLEWIKRHFVPMFGKYVVRTAIITKDKHGYDGAVLIDDRPEIRNSEAANWRQIVFDRQYNQLVNRPRLRGWLDVALPGLVHRSRIT